jgi:AcrR family transcriptional regulator
MAATRVRRSAPVSRQRILDAAEQLLVRGGPGAVQVRAVAERVGMTDAGVSHHFGSRDELLVALVHHGGRRVHDAVERVIDSWVDDGAAVAELVARLASLYRQGYAELAVALHAAGWRDTGGGMLNPVVDALHAARQRKAPPGVAVSLADTRLAVAALHQALAIDPVYGAAFRRSAGISARQAEGPEAQLAWWTDTLLRVLDLE